MGISRVQATQANSGSTAVGSQAVTMTATKAGNLLVMCIGLGSIASTDTITMPGGWVQGPHVADGLTAQAEIWYYPNNPGGIVSVTVTLSANATVALTFIEYAGAATVGPLDASGTNIGTLTTAGTVSTTGAITNMADFVDGIIVAPIAAGQTFTTGTGYNKVGTDVTSALFADSTVQEYSATDLPGAQTLSVTMGTSATYAAAIAAWLAGPQINQYALNFKRRFFPATAAGPGFFAVFTNAAGAAAGTDLEAYTPSGIDLGTWTKYPDAIVANNEVVLDGSSLLTFTTDTSGSGQAIYYNNATPPSADYSVQADFHCVTNSGGAYIIARFNTGSHGNAYMLRYRQFHGWDMITLISGGTSAVIGSSTATADMNPGDVVTGKLTLSGSTLTATLTGAVTATWSGTDTQITTAGNTGVYFSNAQIVTAGIHLGNFKAG